MVAIFAPVVGAYSEDAVSAAFQREGLAASRWSNAPGETYESHAHTFHKVLFCLRGGITFRITDSGESYTLSPGDRLDIEPGTPHSAVVGPDGVTCAEAAR